MKVSSKQWIGLQNGIHLVIAFLSQKGVNSHYIFLYLLDGLWKLFMHYWQTFGEYLCAFIQISCHIGTLSTQRLYPCTVVKVGGGIDSTTAWGNPFWVKLTSSIFFPVYLLYDDRTRIQAYLHQRLPLIVVTQPKHNEHRGFPAKHAPCKLRISNDLVTLTVPLSQHTASVSTFENTEHLRLILLVFCQQVAIIHKKARWLLTF